MGKNKEKDNKQKSMFREKLNKIEQVRKEIEKEKKKIVVECAHQNEKGKLKIHSVNEHGEYECKYCKQRFNMDPIKEVKLTDAIKTVHDAIQQIRCYSNIEEDTKLIRLLGELDFNIQETQELYSRVVNVFGKGNGKKKDKNNKNRDDNYGSYGSGPISFIGGGKRR
jgi:type III secretion system FlhB-like substrate exporter